MSLHWILILSIGCPLTYLVGIGVTWALTPDDWDDGKIASSLLWPFAGPAILACAVTKRIVASSRRPKLPRAEVRR